MRRARGKRLRLAFRNTSQLVRHGRRLHLRFAAGYPHLDSIEAVAAALRRIHALPCFG